MKIFGKDAEDLGSIHFIGMGGIGMSGLAECLFWEGFKVQGSDRADNANMKRLAEIGVTTFVGHKAEQVQGVALVIVSTAIGTDNAELQAAEEAGIQIIHRADILAEIMKNYRTIAVTGTHGKTSTTALIWAALKAAKVDCGIINGGVVNQIRTNAALPRTEHGWLVVEADESDNSFSKLTPTLAVVTNIEPEHMETYGGDESKLLDSFQKFMNKTLPDYGVVICGDDPHLQALKSTLNVPVKTYGVDAGADIQLSNIERLGWETGFTLSGFLDGEFKVNLPGEHYAYNAAPALAVVKMVQFDPERGAKGLIEFRGVGRRFSKVGEFCGATVVDDYAHHPTEIKATIAAANGLTNGKVVAVLQPHRYSRLKDLMDDFATSTTEAGATFVLPVYTAGEDPIDGVDSEHLVAKMDNTQLVEPQNLAEALKGCVEAGDVVLVMGAGSSTTFAKELASNE